MEYNFSTLIVLAEVPTAFVEFSAIIASIRVTFAEALIKFQNLLVHFLQKAACSVSVFVFFQWCCGNLFLVTL